LKNAQLSIFDSVRYLALADSEHLGTALWASTLCGWLAILHFDGLWIAHFPFSAAFHTVRLHLCTSFYIYER
jgi:hypothetical protein